MLFTRLLQGPKLHSLHGTSSKCLSQWQQLRGFKTTNVIRQKATENTSKKASRDEFFSLLTFAKPEKYKLAGAVGLLFISSGVTMTLPFAIGKIIDLTYTSEDASTCRERIAPVCKILALVFLIGGLANAGRVYLIKTSGERVVRRLRSEAFGSIMKQETAFFDKNRTGELINRLSSDTTVIANSITQNISDGLRSSVQASAAAGMMFYTSPTLAMVGCCIVPIVGVMTVPFGRYIKKLSSNVQSTLAQSTQVAEERISNIRTVRTFGKETLEMSNFDKTTEKVLKLAYNEAKANAAFFGLTGFMGNTLVISVLYVGGILISNGSITVGQLSSFLLYVIFAGASVSGLSSFYTEIMKGLGASKRLFEIINRTPDIPIDSGISPKTQLDGQIEFKNVGFSYPTRPDIRIFNQLNLSVPPGQVTALVGPSGSGKSTITSLLLRLYNTQSGEITLDKMNITDYNPNYLRNNIGVVAQEPVLFSCSIRDNITYGITQPELLTDEQIEKAAHEANAWRFISSFPERLDTLVGERGIMLSGGQKQRVAIARAILKNPRLLILDEATSALDSESEYMVQEALQRLMVNRTVIVIAHRLSTIKHASNIVVLDSGRIVESGSFEQLITKADGKFRGLVEKQTFT